MTRVVLGIVLALGLLASPAQARARFTFGIRVTSPSHPITVVVRWRETCKVGEGKLHTHGEFWGTTPVTRVIPLSVSAKSCHLTAVAWQTNRPHWQDGVQPIVQTWVRH